jgi:hypothetical protein
VITRIIRIYKGVMYIYHLTLTTGHTARTSRADVGDEALAIVVPWLRRVVDTGQPAPLPAESLRHFSAIAFERDGGLLVTVYGPIGPHTPGNPAKAGLPLVTFAVAHRSRHGVQLWDMLIDSFPAHPAGIKQPATPWCATVLHPTAVAYPDSLEWLADFGRCCAWAWITRNAKPEAV